MTVSTRTGRCACGAVAFEAEVESGYSVCHCALCRRWAGGPVMQVPARAVRFSAPGELLRWRSSPHAERASCRHCGSHLHWRLSDGSFEMLSVGALDDQSGLTMAEEVFIDAEPAHYAFADPAARERLTGAELMQKIAAGAGGDGKDR